MYRKLTLSLATMLFFSFSCNTSNEMKKISIAQKDADYIIANLDKQEVLSHFPEKNFSKQEMAIIIDNISKTCDWPNRKGRFIDYVTYHGKRSAKNVAFVYEYFLKCDSVRFVLIYDMDQKEPDFYSVQVQPLETKGPLVSHPERQLLHSK